MSAEDANLTFEADNSEADFPTSSDVSDPIIQDFIEEVLALAQRKASLSTKYTVRDIILASKLILPGSLGRAKGGTKVTPFGLALKEERASAPPDVLKQQAGLKRNGAPGLDGRYMKWVGQQYNTPEKNAYYREKAKHLIEEGKGRSQAQIVDLKQHQTRRLRDLENLALDLARQDIHILCLAASDEKIKPLFFRTSGPAEDFWHLLTKDNLNHEDFISAVRGALISREGKKAAVNAAASATQPQPNNPGAALELEGGRQMRDRLRKEIPSQLCDLINGYNITPGITRMCKLPRKDGALAAAMQLRKLKWRHPWGEAIDVEKVLTSTDLKDMKLVSAALKEGKLEPIHYCR